MCFWKNKNNCSQSNSAHGGSLVALGFKCPPMNCNTPSSHSAGDIFFTLNPNPFSLSNYFLSSLKSQQSKWGKTYLKNSIINPAFVTQNRWVNKKQRFCFIAFTQTLKVHATNIHLYVLVNVQQAENCWNSACRNLCMRVWCEHVQIKSLRFTWACGKMPLCVNKSTVFLLFFAFAEKGVICAQRTRLQYRGTVGRLERSWAQLRFCPRT